MSFDTFYPNRKDWRRPYLGRGRCSRGCRPHGNCDYCLSDRQHANRRREPLPDVGLEALPPEPAPLPPGKCGYPGCSFCDADNALWEDGWIAGQDGVAA